MRKDASVKIDAYIACFAAVGIAAYLILSYTANNSPNGRTIPLYAVLVFGGIPLVTNIARKLIRGELGADLLAGISIIVSASMGQYLVGSILVLMLSGGAALERFAAGRASSVLDALAKRMPKKAHRMQEAALKDISTAEIAIGDKLVVLPHEFCPVDGIVVEGHGTMDESYLTGEPFLISKTPGSWVISGAVNGEHALVIVAEKLAADSRYARIMQVMEDAESRRPRLRRLGDRLAAWYTPLTLVLAGTAWLVSGNPERFLAVLVVATPCPLLIAIPIAVIGAISLSASRSIIIKKPAILEQINQCQTIILDKTGTLTFGKPSLTEIMAGRGFTGDEALRLAASLEQYSRHPLAEAIMKAAIDKGLALGLVGEAAEKPGIGLSGVVDGKRILVTGRKTVDPGKQPLPPAAQGLECLVFIDDSFAAALRFHDAPQPESRPFLSHLTSKHQIAKVMLVSGDRESEVRYLAESVGIKDIAAGKSPEEKVAIVLRETKKADTLFVGDGINDAPALATATVGVAIGVNSDITTEAAGAVILIASIGKLDELFHIARRMRRIALQSAIGGMALSVIGMLAAASGHLPPLEGAVLQEIIDLAAIINAIRTALPPMKLTDF